MALITPGQLMARARPILLGEDRPAVFTHLAVEARIVSDHHRGVGCQRMYGRVIDPLTSDIGICDAGNARYLGRDRFARLMELIERLDHAVDAAARAVLELDDAKLDNLVARVINAGGLRVEDQTDKRRLVWRINALGERLDPPQHPVLTSAIQHARNAVEGFRHCRRVPVLRLAVDLPLEAAMHCGRRARSRLRNQTSRGSVPKENGACPSSSRRKLTFQAALWLTRGLLRGLGGFDAACFSYSITSLIEALLRGGKLAL